MHSEVEVQQFKLFDDDKAEGTYKVLKHADSRDFVEIDGKITYIMPEHIDVIGQDAFNGSKVQMGCVCTKS